LPEEACAPGSTLQQEVLDVFQILDGTSGDVLAVEISGGYTRDDVEQFKKAFEDALAAGADRINVLCKIDKLKFSQSEFSAFVADARYGFANMDKIRHIAVVADSGVMKLLVKLDNAVFGDTEKGLVEKYFDVAALDDAWAFVRG